MNDKSHSWLLALLALLTLLPAGFVLWFMNEAVTTQSTAARQQVLEAYRGQLRLVRSRIDAHWRAEAARLRGGDDAGPRFARLVRDGLADGAVLLEPGGSVAYPDRGSGNSTEAASLDRALAEGAAADLDRIAAALDNYTLSMSADERLALMGRLRTLSPNVSIPTEAALRLSVEFAESGRPVARPEGFRETALRDVWALTSEDGQVIALYRTGRLEAVMHDFLHQVTPAGIRFIAVPPDENGGPEAIAAGPWMPGWQLTFQPLDMTPLDAAGRQQAIVYVSVAAGGIALIALVGATAGRAFRQQLQLARLKADLTAAVSHELRTPLASMRVLVDGLLADAVLDPVKTREYLQLMAGENARLTRLIENFLTFSRLERNRHTFTFAAAHPSTIVSTAVEAIRDRVPGACDIQVDVPPELPTLVGDAEALSTALVNLLDNALKYTRDDKRIRVRARRDGETFVSFVVEDNGIGIPTREQRRIFRRFYRVDARLSQEVSGVGLGLSIVELIARAHRGTVSVQSEAGAGSTFTLRVPCGAGTAA